MKIELLCTGDEILTGKTVNTNYSHIARVLFEQGFDVHWGTVVGDDRETLAAAFLQASERADAVIVNGGLGPTLDDLTQEVAAGAARVPLVLHEKWLDRVAGWYRARGRRMPENNRKQAMLPEGAEFLDNPIGTACGFALDIGGARFYFTPGVPKELYRMLEEQVVPRLQGLRGESRVTRIKRFHTFGIGESRADRMLDGIQQQAGDLVKLGFQSHYPQLETKLVARARTAADIDLALSPVEQEVRSRLGNFVVSEDRQSIEENILSRLAAADGTVCVVEMHTAGMIHSRLLKAADRPGRIRRGLVSMDAAEVGRFLGIGHTGGPRKLAREVSGCTETACRRLGSSCLLLVLSEYVPDGTRERGFAEVAVVVADAQQASVRCSRLPGSVEWTRIGAVELGLDCLRRMLEGLPVDEKIDFEQQ